VVGQGHIGYTGFITRYNINNNYYFSPERSQERRMQAHPAQLYKNVRIITTQHSGQGRAR